jgi:phosphoglycerate kinase
MSRQPSNDLRARFKKKTVEDIDVRGKKVLLRVDYNVPVDKNNNITDDSRIRASLPTLKYIIERSAKVILCSHFGRPKGKVVESLRLKVAAERLSELIGKKIKALSDCVGEEVKRETSALKEGEIIMLENLRFHPEEEANDPEFARSLASLADVYVNDAFGVSHRAHASVTGVSSYLPAVAGFLMEKELSFIGHLLEDPERPFVAVMGGAKVSDKLGVIQNIIGKIDTLLIGGGMAANFLKAKGLDVGSSSVEADRLDYAKSMLDEYAKKGINIILPEDVVVCEKIEEGASCKIVKSDAVPENWRIADIGPKAVKAFSEIINNSKSCFWNGPMGVFEIEEFSQGTRSIAKAIAGSDTVSIVGGGSTAEAVVEMGLAEKMTHVSTGGGASLELLEGKDLPGVAVLQDK